MAKVYTVYDVQLLPLTVIFRYYAAPPWWLSHIRIVTSVVVEELKGVCFWDLKQHISYTDDMKFEGSWCVKPIAYFPQHTWQRMLKFPPYL